MMGCVWEGRALCWLAWWGVRVRAWVRTMHGIVWCGRARFAVLDSAPRCRCRRGVRSCLCLALALLRMCCAVRRGRAATARLMGGVSPPAGRGPVLCVFQRSP